MELIQIAKEYINFLWSIYKQDMTNLSQWWMWAFLAIPGIGYLIFFFIRWCLITTPLWLPFFLALSGIKCFSRSNGKTKQWKEKDNIYKHKPVSEDQKGQ